MKRSLAILFAVAFMSSASVVSADDVVTANATISQPVVAPPSIPLVSQQEIEKVQKTEVTKANKDALAKKAAEAATNKEIAVTFWNALFNQHDLEVVDSMVGSKYIQHNPTYTDGKKPFKEAVAGFLAEFPESTAEIKHVAAEGDLVFIHNHIKLNATDRGQAAVDIFRIKDGKIIEHWDVIQDVPETAVHTNTMF